MTPTLIAPARDAYDALAPVYDVLTARYAYDRWLAALEDLALVLGAVPPVDARRVAEALLSSARHG